MSRFDNHSRFRNRQHRSGDKVTFGSIVLMIGVLLMLKKLNIFHFNLHDFWPIILVAVGLLIGIKKRFQNNAWWILVLIGVVNMVPEFRIMNTTSSSLIAPLALIIGGLVLIMKPKRNGRCNNDMQIVTNPESSLNVDVTFGGRKEIVTSKDFKGGNISCTFGGVEVNMLQADTSGPSMMLNVKVSFGAIELVVPSNWDLQNEIDPTFGGVEDHRVIRTGATNTTDERKILILRGTCSFGNIEIKSY